MAEPTNEELLARIAGLEKRSGSKKIGMSLFTRYLKVCYICSVARRLA